jgi:hypothetical protein
LAPPKNILKKSERISYESRRNFLVDTSPLSFPDSGENVQVRGKESVQKDVVYLSHQEHKSFKHGREVPPATQLQYLKPQFIAQALAHHNFVFTIPKSVRNDSQDLQVMVTKANNIKGHTWYIECDIVAPKELRASTPIQLPVVRGKTPTTKHKDNVQDLFRYIFHNPVTLTDICISEQRNELVMQTIAEVWTTGICNPGENGQSLHDLLFAYLSQTPEGIKLRQQGGKSNKF